MLPRENLLFILAFILASTLTPLTIRFLVHKYPAKVPIHAAQGKKYVLRNKLIELSGTVFLIAGAGIPFLFQRSNRLDSTLPNILMILGFGALAMISGMALLANILGDRGAKNYLDYCESEHGMSRTGVRAIAKFVTVCAIITLIAAAFLEFQLK